jgi:hypothetical protein
MAESLRQGTTDDVNALETGEAGAARLRLLDHVYGPATHSMRYLFTWGCSVGPDATSNFGALGGE